jgi:DNA-binding NtrC family response regulator
MENPQGSAPDHNIVLVVEDEPLVRMFAAEALMDEGYRVFEAHDARDALTILDHRRDIGVVVTDVEMPGGMDGLALASTIRDRWPETVILVNSGRVRPEPNALPIGASFIAKPYRISELVDQLERLCEQIGVRRRSDDDILEAWYAAELAHAKADPVDKPTLRARAMAAEQMAIARFGYGAHSAVYDARFPDRPPPRP